MRLRRMLELQKEFNNEFLREAMPEIDIATYSGKEKYTQYVLMLMMRELMEVYDETNFKRHVFEKKDINREQIKEELVDVQKFLLNLILTWDIDPAEFFKAFIKKHEKVNARWKEQLSKRKENKKKAQSGWLERLP